MERACSGAISLRLEAAPGRPPYTSSSRAIRLGVALHSFRNENAAQALKNAPTTPAEIVEVIGYERGFTVDRQLARIVVKILRR
jgi:hypothetical protein